MVRGHETHGTAAQHARAVELPTIQQHLTKAQVVGGRRHAPAPPESFLGGVVTSRSLIGQSGSASPTRPSLSFSTKKPVSVILSGLNTRASRNRPSVVSDAASTTRPSTSVDRLYSQTVPG